MDIKDNIEEMLDFEYDIPEVEEKTLGCSKECMTNVVTEEKLKKIGLLTL